MRSEIAALNRLWVEASQGSGRQSHVGGIQKDEYIRMQAPDQAGDILGSGGGVDATPVRMAECACKDGAERVVAMPGISDAKLEVHQGRNCLSHC